MSITVDVNGITYTIPTSGETGWGSEVTAWINAMSQGVLQKKGGTFTLTANVDFGNNFGIYTKYLTSKTAASSQSGVIRLANSDNVSWRNNANDADIGLTVNANDLLEFNGGEILDADSPQEIHNKTIDLDQTDPNRNYVLNALLDIFETGVVTTTIDSGSTDDQIATALATKSYTDAAIVGSGSGSSSLVGEEQTDYTFTPIVGWDTTIYFSVNGANKNINTVEATTQTVNTGLSFTPTEIRCSSDGDVVVLSDSTANANQGVVQIIRTSTSTSLTFNGGAGDEAGKQIAVSSDGSLVAYSQGGELKVFDFSTTEDLVTAASVTSYGDNPIFSTNSQVVTTSYDGSNFVVIHRWDLSGTWSETTSTTSLTYSSPFIASDNTYIYLNDSASIVRYDGAFSATPITTTNDIVGGLGISDDGSKLFTMTEVGEIKYFTQLLTVEENTALIQETTLTVEYLQSSADGSSCAVNTAQFYTLFSKDGSTWYSQEGDEFFCFGIDSTPIVTKYTMGLSSYDESEVGYLLEDGECLYIDGELTGTNPTVRTVVKDDIENVQNSTGRFIICRRVDNLTYWDNTGKHVIKIGATQQFGFIPYQQVSTDNDGYLTSEFFDGYNTDLYTGLYFGGHISVNSSDNTKFDLEGGFGIVMDVHTDPANPVLQFVFWEDQEAITVDNLATSETSYITIDSTSSTVQLATQPTVEQRRDLVYLGILVHPNNVSITEANQQTYTPLATPGTSLTDFALAVGSINVSGNEFAGNSPADLKITKSAGDIFRIGSNFFANKKNPNVTPQVALTPATTFVYTYKDAVGWQNDVLTDPNNDVDPENYNVAGTGLVAMTATYYQVQRIYLTTSNLVIIFYGQDQYETEADAIAAINSEQFEFNPDAQDAILRTYMIIQQGETNSSNAVYIQAGKFGGESTSGATTQTSTMQATYENSSRPQIELNDSNGGMQVVDNATPISDPMISYQDSTETDTYFNVTPDGARKKVSVYEEIATPSTPLSGFTKIWMDLNARMSRISSSGVVIKVGDDGDMSSGMAIQQADVVVSSDGVNITVSVEADGGGNMGYLIGEIPTDLDCTPPATTNLTPGTATDPVVNYVYVTGVAAVGTLESSTTFPTGEFAWVGQFAVPDAVTAQTTGAYSSQRFSDVLRFVDGRGALSYEREKIRVLGADWDSGVLATLTINAGASPDNVQVSSSSGIVYQLHRQTYPAYVLDDDYYIANDSVTPYKIVTDLNGELTDAEGNSLSGRYHNLVMWGAINKSTGECKRFINLPVGSYSSASTAISDADGTSVTSIPSQFKKTGFLICRLVLKHSAAGGGTWTNTADAELGVNNIDLRGLKPGFNLNQASVPSVSEFLDGVFRVNNSTDSTKQIAFSASSIATGTTRTYVMPDATGQVVLADAQQTLTNKIYNGGSADDAIRRLLVPVTTDDASLASLTPSSGNLVQKLTDARLYLGDGSAFNVVGGGLIPVEIDHTFGGTLESGNHYVIDMSGASGDVTFDVEAGAIEKNLRVTVIGQFVGNYYAILDANSTETFRYDGSDYDQVIVGEVSPWCLLTWDATANWVVDDPSTFTARTLAGDWTADSLNVNNDLAVDTDTLYVDSVNNRVGINTSNPTVTKDIQGSTISGVPLARIGSTGINIAAFIGAFSNAVFIQGALNNDFSSEYGLALQPNGGNVGIGSTNPSYLLDAIHIGAGGGVVASFGSSSTALSAYIGTTSNYTYIQSALRTAFGTEYPLYLNPNGGNIAMPSLPTSNPGGSGILWNDGGTVKIT